MPLRGVINARHQLLAGCAVLLTLLVGLAPPASGATTMPPGPSTTVPVPSPVDPYAAYVGQTTCDPTVKPGPAAVIKMAMAYYKIGRSTGITRDCGIGAQSEHKEGRAFDWGLNVNNPAEKAAGDAFTEWLTATGPDGKPGYNARRLGVMYVIWNKQIWTAYSAVPGWRAYYGASPHTDHVHVSFSWNGAYQRTSWWTGSLVAQAPIGSLDAVTTTDVDLTVHGWAMDPDTSRSTDVHVYVNGVRTSAKADRSRPDIGARYGRGDNHGFAVTLPQKLGTHEVCVHAIDSDPTGSTLLGCRTVVVQNNAPIGAVDSITPTSTSLTFSGWAFDPDTTAPAEVHVYIDGKGVAIKADQSRPDVGRAFGRGDLHGFSYTATVTPGRHDVCLYAINTRPGANTQLLCRAVVAETPPTAPPIGSLDTVAPSPTGVTVSGWALDPDTTDPSFVHLYVNGVGTELRADLSRPDVAAAYGKGDRHGFSATVPLREGNHSMCAHAINTGAGSHKLLGCRSFTVKNHAPVGSLDSIVPSSGAVTLSGWAMDPDTPEPTHVHVYIDGVGVAVRSDQSRPDVAAVFGGSDRRGFTQKAFLAPGEHRVCVYGIDTTGPGHTLLACRPFTVPA